MPWPRSATHFQHAPWRTQEPRISQDRFEWVLCPETERSSRTRQIQVESTEGRRVVRCVPDEPSRAGKILRLWHFGRGHDKRPNCRDCSSQTLKQKLLQQEDLDLAKTVRIVRNAETAVQEARLLSQGTRENPIQIDHVHASRGSQAKTFSCYRCGGTDGHAPDECGAIKSKCNKRKKVRHLHRVCRSESKADQRKGKKGKEKKPPMEVRSLNSKPGTDLLENSSDDESEKPVLSLNNGESSITLRFRCNSIT